MRVLTAPGSSPQPGFTVWGQNLEPKHFHDVLNGQPLPTSYCDASGIGPEHGLAAAVTQDPGALALTTTTTYGRPDSGRWLRRTGRSLPGVTATTYQYYCSRPGAPAAGAGGRAEAVSLPADAPARARQTACKSGR